MLKKWFILLDVTDALSRAVEDDMKLFKVQSSIYLQNGCITDDDANGTDRNGLMG